MWNNNKKENIKWVKNEFGKWIPCDPKIVRFLVNPYGPVYYTLDGKRFRGVEHPSGALLGYRVLPPKKQEKTYYR